MSDVTNPQGTLIQLDRARYIKFSFNAFCEIKKILDEDVLEALQSFEPYINKKTGQNIIRLPFDTIRCFLWAGLLGDDNTLTVGQVGALVEDYLDENSPADLISIIMTTLNDSKLFKKLIEEGKKAEAEAKKSGTKNIGKKSPSKNS